MLTVDSGGFYRVGTLILLVHDVADIFLELGKSLFVLGVSLDSDLR